ncbi:MAG TPA: PIN domain-containing protein [Thermoanaerobaculia bacterium]|nr:PIN domain-containing protein [Thermoanaerobaculia bacterium]
MVIADTGFWLALANRNDRYHALANERLRELREPLVTTWPVVTETCYLLLSRLGTANQRTFVDSFAAGAFEVFDLRREHGPRISALMKTYSDLPMDLADASLVLLAEELDDGRILSTDARDFRTYRWKHREPFENVLLGAGGE